MFPSLIKNLLPPGSLDSGTKVVLVDTIYFKSNWGIPFKPKLTSVKTFTRDDGNLEEVKMMFGANEAQYGETQLKKIGSKPSSIPDQKIKILGIQYANPNLAMFFVLPEQKGLPNLIKVLLSFKTLATLIKTAKETLVDITLPIFKTSYDVSLPETLKNLGLRNIFEGSADFSGLTKSDKSSGLCISEILHKAVIEVNEKGTEAAAATGVVMRNGLSAVNLGKGNDDLNPITTPVLAAALVPFSLTSITAL
ncbi:serpin B4-like [Gordionus sp. m RMFG-2023]|uniref:serpin B4-like n=1 Tax=Gordionus sp. m RMFG-2023 TaxID=3053472 RepID=UPI0031FC45E6